MIEYRQQNISPLPHLVQGLHDVAGLVLLGRQNDVNDLIMIIMMMMMMIIVMMS